MRRSAFPQKWIKMKNITEDSESEEYLSIDEEEEKPQTPLKEEERGQELMTDRQAWKYPFSNKKTP